MDHTANDQDYYRYTSLDGAFILGAQPETSPLTGAPTVGVEVGYRFR